MGFRHDKMLYIEKRTKDDIEDGILTLLLSAAIKV